MKVNRGGLAAGDGRLYATSGMQLIAYRSAPPLVRRGGCATAACWSLERLAPPGALVRIGRAGTRANDAGRARLKVRVHRLRVTIDGRAVKVRSTTARAALALLAALVLAAPAAAGDWVTYQGDPGRSGTSDDPSLRPPFAVRWRVPVPLGQDQDVMPPLVAGGRVFVGMRHGGRGTQVAAFDAATGALLWRGDTVNGDGSGEFAYESGRIVIIDDSELLTALSATTGEVVWQVDAPGASRLGLITPGGGNGLVYTSYGPGAALVEAWDVTNGALRWKQQIAGGNGNGSGAVAVAGGRDRRHLLRGDVGVRRDHGRARLAGAVHVAAARGRHEPTVGPIGSTGAAGRRSCARWATGRTSATSPARGRGRSPTAGCSPSTARRSRRARSTTCTDAVGLQRRRPPRGGARARRRRRPDVAQDRSRRARRGDRALTVARADDPVRHRRGRRPAVRRDGPGAGRLRACARHTRAAAAAIDARRKADDPRGPLDRREAAPAGLAVSVRGAGPGVAVRVTLRRGRRLLAKVRGRVSAQGRVTLHLRTRSARSGARLRLAIAVGAVKSVRTIVVRR